LRLSRRNSASRDTAFAARQPGLAKAGDRSLLGAAGGKFSPSHAREKAACSPLRRQRKLGVRDEDGNLVRFPYLRPVSDRNGPRDWRAWSPAQKLEYLLGMSLDDSYEIMSWPVGELDPFRLSMRAQVMRVVFAIGVKALLDGTLGREPARERTRDAELARLSEAVYTRTCAASDD
jgi:hypothetical protein